MSCIIDLVKWEGWIGIGSIATAATFIFGAYVWRRDAVDTKSKFYLEECIHALDESIVFFSERDNNSLMWSSGVQRLILVDRLKQFITNREHQLVIKNRILITAQHINRVLKKIAFFEFFYGVPNYEDFGVRRTPHNSSELYKLTSVFGAGYCSFSLNNARFLLAFLCESAIFEVTLNNPNMMQDSKDNILQPLNAENYEYYKRLNDSALMKSFDILVSYIENYMECQSSIRAGGL